MKASDVTTYVVPTTALPIVLTQHGIFFVHQYLHNTVTATHYCTAAASAEQDGMLPSLGSGKLWHSADIFLVELERSTGCRLVSLVPDPTLHVQRKKDTGEPAACHANTYDKGGRTIRMASPRATNWLNHGFRRYTGNTLG